MNEPYRRLAIDRTTGLSADLSIAAAQIIYRDQRSRDEHIPGQDEVSAAINLALQALESQFVTTADLQGLGDENPPPELDEQLALDFADRREFGRDLDKEPVSREVLDALNRLVGVYGAYTVQAILIDSMTSFRLRLAIDEPLVQPLCAARWHYVPGDDESVV